MSLSKGGEKRYGLIIPGKKPNELPKPPSRSAFADDSEDEEDAKFKQPNFDVKLETIKANLRKKTKINIEKALEEDASIFLYDEVYDEISKVKDKKVLEKCLPSARKPKYVEKLLKASAVRKLEHELLSERKAQRDLEAEKEKYADKESFVTGAYKEKMSEIRLLVERRQEEEAHEEVMDVTKQDGLGGFYRFMYQQKTASTNLEEPEENTEKEEQTDNEIPNTSCASLPKMSERMEPTVSSDNTKYTQEKSRSSAEQDPSHPKRIQETSRSDLSSHSSKGNSIHRKHSDSSHHSRRHHDSLHRRSRSKSRESRRSNNHHHGHGSHRKEPTHKSDAQQNLGTSVSNSPKRAKTPPGFIRAKPRSTTDEELAAFSARFLSRKEAGIHADIVLSDDEI